MKRYIILLGLFAWLFGACTSTSVDIQYYYLPNSEFIPPVKIGNAIEIKVSTADRLSSPSMVIGTKSNASIILTNNHLWANDLAKMIQSSLSNKLNQLGKGSRYYFSIYPGQQESEKLEVVIEKFQGSLYGAVEIIGHTNLLDDKNNIKNSMAFKEKLLQKKPGYQEMVEIMDQALIQVANKIYTFFKDK